MSCSDGILRCGVIAPVLVSVLTALGPSASLAAASAQQVPKCHAHLVVKLSPEVPNPRDPQFLSSLAGAPGFRLIWRGHTDMSQRLELVGPGPEYRCTREIDRIRNDARIINLQVLD